MSRKPVTEHEGNGAVVDEKCRHCGVAKTSWDAQSCHTRYIEPMPRAVPQSVFADLGAIGDRLAEIRREETAQPLTLEEQARHKPS